MSKWKPQRAKKLWTTLTANAPGGHRITQCIKRMQGKVDSPGGFCKWLSMQVGYVPKRKKKK